MRSELNNKGSAMDDSDLSDAAVEVDLTGPDNRGGGFYRYERYRVRLDGAAFERDAVRIGRVVVILPVDLERDEIVLIRQFRLGAHLALGKGDMVELPAGGSSRAKTSPMPPAANATKKPALRRGRWCRCST